MTMKNSIPVAEPAEAPPTLENRYVYGSESTDVRPDFPPRSNRPLRLRRKSPFKIIMTLMAISLLIVFYVWNKISVNRLVVQADGLQNQLRKLEETNRNLRAEINKKSNLGRIEKLATLKLGLVAPKEPPVWFEVDPDRLKEIQR